MKTLRIMFILILFGAAAGLFLYWQNNSIVTTRIEFRSDTVPEGFRGYTIVQISDLHNTEFGRDHGKVMAKIQAANPDILVITGDLIDSRRTQVSTAMEFVQKAAEIAPVFYVSGNHEKRSGVYAQLRSRLEQAGVTVLDNTAVTLEQGHDRIALLGIADPEFIEYEYDFLRDDRHYFFSETLESVAAEYGDDFTILLSHRPEKMSVYAYHEIDLVFAGHAHGGQFRLPFIGGLVAPDQGFFPRYDSGMYVKDSTAMVVSRGLGNSIIPFRLFNRPELVVVTLEGQR